VITNSKVDRLSSPYHERVPDGGEIPLSSPRTYSADEVNMDLTMCGLLPERAAELAQLYREHGNWNRSQRDLV